MISDELAYFIVYNYGYEIINSLNMQKEKEFIQHGSVSVFDHCLNVATMCVKIASLNIFKVDYSSLIRGALLHDYFLYDWHNNQNKEGLHGYRHAKIALKNAKRDFNINNIEANMIKSHMFPLNLFSVPKYNESIILCIADKICATKETFLNRKLTVLKK